MERLPARRDKRDRARGARGPRRRARATAASACSARPCATARSSTTSSRRPTSFRSAGPTSRTPGSYRLERARRRGALRLRRRPALLEAVPASRRASGSGRRSAATDGGSSVEEPSRRDAPLAFFGVRSCELHAIAIQDRVLLEGAYVDRDYAARREDAFVVAVNCFEPGGTCFCVSMGTGPKAEAGLRPRADGDPRRRAPLPRRGRQRARRRGARRAPAARRRRSATSRPPARRSTGAAERDGARARHDRHARPARAQPRAPALGRGRRALPDLRQLHDGLPDLLLHDRRGRHRPGRRRAPSACALWDSCFSVDHSYIHGGSVRPSGRSRYRQWLTHKFGTWHDQFGTSGCVGCGRCITWCPVGIDVTEELTAIRATEEVTHGDD